MWGNIVSSVCDMLTQAGKIAEPMLQERRAQAERKAHDERIQQWVKTLGSRDPERIAGAVHGLLLLAERPIAAGTVDNSPIIELPLEYFNALFIEVSEGVMNARQLASMTEKATK